MSKITVVGAGLAGCEAAWQCAERGVPVTLIEMKPLARTPAHHSDDFAELVCSNSLRGDRAENAPGLLKAELRRAGSLILRAADACRVPAGGALAVDRDGFSRRVTEIIYSHPLITVKAEVCEKIPDGDCIIATGPLTGGALAADIDGFFDGTGYLAFYDAAAPLIAADSIDMDFAFIGNRYGDGEGDYINCPMTKEEFTAFHTELINAREAPVHGFEDRLVFEGCMPVEVMARRGQDTLRFGTMRPVGLRDPRTGKGAYAVVQLRRDNAAGSVYNIVGFQTHLAFPEQKRVFSMIPALGRAEFLRYGVMHRNSFLCSPKLLDRYFHAKKESRVGFAGQLTGVEGYVESTASGLMSGICAARRLRGLPPVDFPDDCMTGALASYIANAASERFQPMNSNFGLLPPLADPPRDKKEKYRAMAARAMASFESVMPEIMRLRDKNSHSITKEGIPL